MLIERGGQSLERLRARFTRHAVAHHAPPDEALELRRIAFRFRGAGAVGQAVAEGEHHRFARQALEARALAACRDAEGEDERQKEEQRTAG